MDAFRILLDAPGEPASRMPLAKLGDYSDPKRYGDFAITEDDVAAWRKNLSALPGGRALIDFDHRADKPAPHRDTKAAGWITGIETEGDMVWGTTEWSSLGEDAVRQKQYLFTSPVFGPYTNEHGETFDNTLTGAALTNKPFLGSMPMVTLASESNIQRALDLDPAAALYQKALDGDLGDEVKLLAEGAATADEDCAAAISAAARAVGTALSAQQKDPDKGDPNDRAVLSALRRAASALDDAEMHQTRDSAGEKPVSMLELDEAGGILELDTLSTDARNNLKDSDFALPGHRYPIHDLGHARNALARVAQNGTPDEQSKVKAAVHGRYPELKPGSKTQMDADSRPQMKFDADKLKALGIADESAITQILALIEEGKDADAQTALEAAVAAARPEVKTLEQLAEDEGVVTLSKDDHDALQEAKRQLDESGAAEPTKTLEQRADEAGLSLIDPDKLTSLETAADKVTVLETAVQGLQQEAEDSRKALDAQRFETAFEDAQREGKAVPEQREHYEKIFTLDQDTALQMLENAPALLNVKPLGKNHSPRGDELPDNVSPERHELMSKVEAYQQENPGADFMVALEAVSGEPLNAVGAGV